MSLYVNTVAKTPFPTSSFVKICNKFSKLMKNINNQYIELYLNQKSINLDKHRLLNNLQHKIAKVADNDAFKQSEKTIQISSTINATIDKVQADFLINPNKNQSVIKSDDKKAIFKHVTTFCHLQDSDIDINASQQFIKQLLQDDPKVKEAIQYLKLKAKSLDINKINTDSAATTKYVVEMLNDTVCKDFYPDIDFGKIRESAAQSTRHILEKKLSEYHCKKIGSYILATEGTAV